MASVVLIIFLLLLGVLVQLNVAHHARKTSNNTSEILENILKSSDNNIRKHNQVRKQVTNEIKKNDKSS